MNRQNEDLSEICNELQELKSLVISLRDDIASLEKTINHHYKRILPYVKNTSRSAGAIQESLWSDIFHDAISGSKWFDGCGGTYGRWAIGYQFAYVLFRILDDIMPKTVLELGMGQSTVIVNQYASHNSGVSHTVVENDREWISFFSKHFRKQELINLVQLDAGIVKYGD